MPEYSQSTIHIRSPVSRKFSHSGSQWQGASAAGCASSAARTAAASATAAWYPSGSVAFRSARTLR